MCKNTIFIKTNVSHHLIKFCGQSFLFTLYLYKAREKKPNQRLQFIQYQPIKTTTMNKSGLFLGGMLTGAAIGAAVGILFAPKSGKETREDMLNKLHDLENELITIRNKTKEKGIELKDEIRSKVTELERKLERVMAAYKHTEAGTM